MKMLQAQYIQNEITALLLAHPELAEDEVLRADSIEGETGAFEFLSNIVRKIDDAAALAAGAAIYIEELRVRQDRLTGRIDALRGLIMKVMNTADLRKAELPEATLSIRNLPPKVLGDGVEGLPPDCVRTKIEPNRTKIKERLQAGDAIFGYILSNGGTTLAILR